MAPENISNIRKDYLKAQLNKSVVGEDPVAFFEKWFDEAVHGGVEEPTAMAISTVSAGGLSSSRTVLLKDIRDGAFVFYTNYSSRKGSDIAQNPNVSLLFYWPELERQVRIEGRAEKVPSSASDEYFASRPAISQVSAIISPQSKPVPDREYLEKLKEEYLSVKRDAHKRPENWGGYAVTPVNIEFWQGRPGRLHDRILFEREGEVWKISRLAP